MAVVPDPNRVLNGRLNRAAEPDGRLLAAFVRDRSEAAFAELVRRHGGTVLGVCRRVLGDTADADDAFQAAFVVLARRAASVRPAAGVASWLYGVAYRTALKARTARARRQAHEAKSAAMRPHPTPAPDPDLLAAVDEELAKLPDRLRGPLLLCDVQGRPQRDAARALGVPVGTLTNRLKAARKALAERLTARGLSLGVSGLAVGVSGRLADAAVRAAVGAELSPAVAKLAEGVMNGFVLTKLRAAVAVLAVAVGVSMAGGDPPQPAARQPAAPPLPAKAAASFLERVLADLRGDGPTAVERNYYAADRPPTRDGQLVRHLIDDPAVKAHVASRFGKSGGQLSLEPTEETAAGVKLGVLRRVEQDGQVLMERIHTFDWTFPNPQSRPTAPAKATKLARLPAYVIEPPDVLSIEVVGNVAKPGEPDDFKPLAGQPITGQFLVRPDGTVGLGTWGDVAVSGLTLTDAGEAVRKQVERAAAGSRLRVSVDVLAYNSKFYYVITDFGGTGEQVVRVPVTGNETVLDAVAQLGMTVPAPGGRVWVTRKAGTSDQVLPVDWVGITRDGRSATNYQLQPGDRVFVKAKTADPDEAARVIRALELERAELLKRYGTDHPDVVRLRAKLEEVRAKAVPALDLAPLRAAVAFRWEELRHQRQMRGSGFVDDADVHRAELQYARAQIDLVEAERKAGGTDRVPDEMFLRGALSDYARRAPTGLETSYFVNDADPDKRAKLIRWLVGTPVPAAPRETAADRYTIAPKDSLLIEVKPAAGRPHPTSGLTFTGMFGVNADGSLPGVSGFDRIVVGGLTVKQAAEAVRAAATNKADADRIAVSVKVDGYNGPRGFELRFDGDVRPIAYQGETVYRHLVRNAEGPGDYDGKHIWIERAGAVLPIDWDGLTRRRDERTNYVVQPGDVVHVSATAPPQRPATPLAKLIAGMTAAGKADADVLDAVFLATVARPPTADERAAYLKRVAGGTKWADVAAELTASADGQAHRAGLGGK